MNKYYLEDRKTYPKFIVSTLANGKKKKEKKERKQIIRNQFHE